MKLFANIFSIKNSYEATYKIKKIRIFNKSFEIKKTPELQMLAILIGDRCNLNCKGCSTYSPLIKKDNFIEPKNFEKDIKELSTKINIKIIQLIGGEPLLHPNLEELLKLARKYYPKSEIEIVTNLILIKKMPESFWNTLKENNISVRYSIYPPMKEHYQEILSYISSKNIPIGMYHIVDKFYRNLSLKKISNLTKLDKKKCKCICLTFKNSRIYPCSFVIETLINHFHLEIPENSSVDIYNNTGKEIAYKLSLASPLCNYCDIDHPQYYDWEKSKQQLSEWIMEN